MLLPRSRFDWLILRETICSVLLHELQRHATQQGSREISKQTIMTDFKTVSPHPDYAWKIFRICGSNRDCRVLSECHVTFKKTRSIFLIIFHWSSWTYMSMPHTRTPVVSDNYAVTEEPYGTGSFLMLIFIHVVTKSLLLKIP